MLPGERTAWGRKCILLQLPHADCETLHVLDCAYKSIEPAMLRSTCMHVVYTGTLDAPRPPSMDRQRSGTLPMHLALVRDDGLPANRVGSKLRAVPQCLQ